MPVQQTAARTVFYGEGDTAPNLVVILEDNDGNPIDLAGAEVFINIAYSSYSYYYSPRTLIVIDGVCVLDNKVPGQVSWTPQPGDLTPAGLFEYTFRVTFNPGSDPQTQTFPPNTYYPLSIQRQVGGLQ